jgi:PEGA domain
MDIFYIVLISLFFGCTKDATREQEKVKNFNASSVVAFSSTRLSISSDPSGAKIFVDGINTNQFTPAIITVSSGKPANIALIKEGFNKYQVVRTVTTASSLSATLQPTTAIGYLNIIVRNGGENPVVFINGVRLNEKLSIVEYAIPSNQEIEIEAKNQLLNSSAKTKIRVMTNKIQTVDLTIGRLESNETAHNKQAVGAAESLSGSANKTEDLLNLWQRTDWNAEFRKCLDRTDLDYIPKIDVKMFKQAVPAQEKFCYAYLTLKSQQIEYREYKIWLLNNVQERLVDEKKVYLSTSKLEW